MASASFTINAGASPQTVSAGATVTIALVSTTGVRAVKWSIEGGSDPDETKPTIVDDTATSTTFTMNTPVGSEGLSWIVKCVVNNGKDDAGQTVSAHTATGIVSVVNAAGRAPFALGEKFERHATYGIVPDINTLWALVSGSDATALRGVNLDAATVGSPTTNWILYYNGSSWAGGPLSDAIENQSWGDTLTHGATSSGTNPRISFGDNLEFSDASHYITPTGGGIQQHVPATKDHEFHVTGTGLVGSVGDYGIYAPIRLTFDGANTQTISADANGLEYHAPTGDTHQWFINSLGHVFLERSVDPFMRLMFDAGQSQTDGAAIIGIATPTSGDADGAHLGIRAQSAFGTNRHGGDIQMLPGTPTGTGDPGVTAFFDHTGVTKIAEIGQLSNGGTLAVGLGPDGAYLRADTGGAEYWVPTGDTHEFFVNSVSQLTVATSLVTVGAGALAIGATVAGTGAIRLPRLTVAAASRNAGDTADISIFGVTGSNTQTFGDGTNGNETQLVGTSIVRFIVGATTQALFGSTSFSISPGGSTVGTWDSGGLTLTSTKTVDFAGEVTITRAAANILQTESATLAVWGPTTGAFTVSRPTLGSATGLDLTLRGGANNHASLGAGNLVLTGGDNAGAGPNGGVAMQSVNGEYALAVTDSYMNLGPTIEVRQVAGTVTGGAGATTVLTWTMADETSVNVILRAVLIDQTANESASYVKVLTVKRHAAGSATAVGTETSVHTAEDDATWNAAITTSGNNIIIQVTPDGTNNTDYQVYAEFFYVTP